MGVKFNLSRAAVLHMWWRGSPEGTTSFCYDSTGVCQLCDERCMGVGSGLVAMVMSLLQESCLPFPFSPSLYFCPPSTCMYTYIYTYMHLHAHLHEPTYTPTCTPTCTYMYTYMYTHMYTYMHLHVHLHAPTCTYMHLHVHLHAPTCTPTWTYLYTYMHLHIHLHVPYGVREVLQIKLNIISLATMQFQ